MHLTLDSITRIELGLINSCVLRCTMCLRQEELGQAIKPGEFLQIEALIGTLDQFLKIETVDLVGSVSEPTLYPHLFKLLEYLNSRKIQVRIGTNANTQSPDFWVRLGKTLKEKDIIRFAIDGSTQELHAKYRVGSNLNRVLENHRLFKNNSTAVTVLQNIIFDYNKDDGENIKLLFVENNFDICEFTESGDSHSLKLSKANTNVRPREELLKRYIELGEYVKKTKIDRFACHSQMQSQLYINHLGVILPCDDMEEVSFEDSLGSNSLPNIYRDELESCMAFVNSIVKGRYLNKECILCCSKKADSIRDDYPIFQCRRDLEIKRLGEFRGIIQ